MPIADLADPATVALVLAGAFAGGFITGLAGFGTGLVASGLWFHALPAPMVPGMVALTSVGAHLFGLAGMRQDMDWRRARPFLAGGAVGAPLGAAALALASPDGLRLAVGILLAGYAAAQVGRPLRIPPAGRLADAGVGLGGGLLGGFAGLSAPLPVIWLRMQGGSPDGQRAVYQPFNMAILSLAALSMAVAGTLGTAVLAAVALALPATAAGAWAGTRLYRRVDARAFGRIVLLLLAASGLALVVDGLAALLGGAP